MKLFKWNLLSSWWLVKFWWASHRWIAEPGIQCVSGLHLQIFVACTFKYICDWRNNSTAIKHIYMKTYCLLGSTFITIYSFEVWNLINILIFVFWIDNCLIWNHDETETSLPLPLFLLSGCGQATTRMHLCRQKSVPDFAEGTDARREGVLDDGQLQTSGTSGHQAL